ncbi:Rho GTPase activation protein [Mycotypha africana]|uniref:Rho GTPase activation protein n=1 Tax=Mycotypha africana TaxID=64632 RepID=UPI00230075DD|nr:Rho GTPase activation protein [Mycotypha africana]KAI8992126.1 Rho GTPase activation protein [Mycotypha africana]
MLYQSILPPVSVAAVDALDVSYTSFSLKKDISKRHTIASYSNHGFYRIFKEPGLPFIQQQLSKKDSMLAHINSVPGHSQPQITGRDKWHLKQQHNSALPEFRQFKINRIQDEDVLSVKEQLLQHWETIEGYYIKRLDSLQKEINNATLHNEKLALAKEELVQNVLQLHNKSMELSIKNESLTRAIAEHQNRINAFMYNTGNYDSSNYKYAGYVDGVTLVDLPCSQQQSSNSPPSTPPSQQTNNDEFLQPPPAISITEPAVLNTHAIAASTDITNKSPKKDSSPGLFRQLSLRLSGRRKRSVMRHDSSSDNGVQINVVQPNNSSTITSSNSILHISNPLSSEKHHHHLSVIHQRGTNNKAAEQQQLLHPAAVLSTSPLTQQGNSNFYFQQKQQSSQPQEPTTATGSGGAGVNNNNNYKSIFGNDLVEQAKAENLLVPCIISHCIKEIESRGLDVEGIYRKSGTYAQVKELQKEFNRENPDLSKYDDVNVITSLLKLYFRELSAPLIPNYFILPSSLTDQERLNKTYAILHQLPLEVYSTVKQLVQHLKRVHQHQSTNRMNSRNLAVVFGPTLMRCSNGDQRMQDIIQTVDFLIQQSHILFADY